MTQILSQVSRRTLSDVLASRGDPLDVLKTTADVVARARHVAIDLRRVRTVAQLLALRPVPVPIWNYDYHFFDGTERTLVYLLLLDAMNFSFWGRPRWTVTYRGERLDGYWALAASLKRGVAEDKALLEASYLAELEPRALAHVLRGTGMIPMFIERWRNAQEVGRVLRDRFDSSAIKLMRQAEQDAPQLAHLIAENINSFHDTTVYEGRQVNFFKRAQILVADIWGSFGGKGWGKFANMDTLTAFADYKLPQLLRLWGVLKYDRPLARRIDQKEALAKDSEEEIEIRAATLWGVEFLREALAQRGRRLTSVQLDWFLWDSSQRARQPYHRVRTIYY